MQKLAKEYYKQRTALIAEKNFGRKVDLNVKIKRFMKANKIETHNDYIYIKGKKIAYIQTIYTSKKVNLTYKKLGEKLCIL